MEPHLEKRSAHRIACELPVLVGHGANERSQGTVVDISRSGVCLRLPGHVLGVHRLSSLVQVARQVSQVLGPRFVTWLGGGEGGLRRTLEPVRICHRDWSRADVELGCALSTPLTDGDLARLRIELPPAEGSCADGGDAAADGEDIAPGAPFGATGETEPRHVGYIVAQEPHRGRPLQGQTQWLCDREVILMVPRMERTPFGGQDIATLIVAFGRLYGERPLFHVLRGARSLWEGPVRVTEVEIPATGRGPMRIRMRFLEPLSTAALEQLGIAEPA